MWRLMTPAAHGSQGYYLTRCPFHIVIQWQLMEGANNYQRLWYPSIFLRRCLRACIFLGWWSSGLVNHCFHQFCKLIEKDLVYIKFCWSKTWCRENVVGWFYTICLSILLFGISKCEGVDFKLKKQQDKSYVIVKFILKLFQSVKWYCNCRHESLQEAWHKRCKVTSSWYDHFCLVSVVETSVSIEDSFCEGKKKRLVASHWYINS